MNFNVKTYKTAKTISMIYGVLGLISGLIMLITKQTEEFSMANYTYYVIDALLVAYLLYEFLHLLNSRLSYKGLNNTIYSVIIVTFGSLIALYSSDFTAIKDFVSLSEDKKLQVLKLIIYLLISVIVSLIMGIKLINKRFNNIQYLKLFGWLTILSTVITLFDYTIGQTIFAASFIILSQVFKQYSDNLDITQL